MEVSAFVATALAPFFVLLLLGWALGRVGFLSTGWREISTKLVFWVTLPALLIGEVAKVKVSTLLSPSFVLWLVAFYVVFIAACWAGALLLPRGEGVRGAFIQASFRGNIAIIGLPLISRVAGPEALAIASALLIVLIPFFTLSSSLVLTLPDGRFSRKDFASSLRSALVNPLPFAILLGWGLSWSGWTLPAPATKVLDSLAGVTFPLSLLVIGAGLSEGIRTGRRRLLLVTVALKSFVMPLGFGLAAFALGWSASETAAAVLVGACPTAVAGFAMARALGQDAEFTGSAVVATTAASLASFPLCVVILRLAGTLTG